MIAKSTNVEEWSDVCLLIVNEFALCTWCGELFDYVK